MTKCDVCNGRGKINVPIFEKISYEKDLPDIHEHLEGSMGSLLNGLREYPCPECSSKLSYVTTKVYCNMADYTEHYENVKVKMARDIGVEMLKKGFIHITVKDDTEMHMIKVVTGTVIAEKPSENFDPKIVHGKG